MWEAAISAVGQVSRGHIKEIRLAADHVGKALQLSVYRLTRHANVSHIIFLLLISLAHTHSCVFRTKVRQYADAFINIHAHTHYTP